MLSGSAGSSYYEAGSTKLFCSVQGPRTAPSAASQYPMTAQLTCDVRWTGFSQPVNGGGAASASLAANTNASRDREAGFATDEERELGASVQRALAGVVLLDRYPKSRIEVSILVLEDAGGAAAAAVTAASLALADAGIEMADLVCGCGVAVVGGQLLIDPSAEEEATASASVVVSYLAGVGRIVGVMQRGDAEVGGLVAAVKECCAGASQVSELMRKVIVKQAQKTMKKRKSRG